MKWILKKNSYSSSTNLRTNFHSNSNNTCSWSAYQNIEFEQSVAVAPSSANPCYPRPNHFRLSYPVYWTYHSNLLSLNFLTWSGRTVMTFHLRHYFKMENIFQLSIWSKFYRKHRLPVLWFVFNKWKVFFLAGNRQPVNRYQTRAILFSLLFELKKWAHIRKSRIVNEHLCAFCTPRLMSYFACCVRTVLRVISLGPFHF